MPTTFSIAVDPAKRRELEDLLAGIPNGMRRVMAPAVNRTAATGKTRIVRRLGKELTLKRASIAEVVTVRKTSAKSDNVSASIKLSDSPRPLFDFPHRETAKGVRVRVRKSKPAELLGRAFEATVPAGKTDTHRGIFQRVKGRDKYGKLTKEGYAQRLPIKEMFGPAVTSVFANAPGVAQEEVDGLGPVLERNVDSQVNRLLNRKKPST